MGLRVVSREVGLEGGAGRAAPAVLWPGEQPVSFPEPMGATSDGDYVRERRDTSGGEQSPWLRSANGPWGWEVSVSGSLRSGPAVPLQASIELRASEARLGHLGGPTWCPCQPQALDGPLTSVFKTRPQPALMIKSLTGPHTVFSLRVIMINPHWALTRRRPASLGCQAARTPAGSDPDSRESFITSQPWVAVGTRTLHSPTPVPPATTWDPHTVLGDSILAHFPVL